MTSQIFDALLREKADVFKAAFSSVSTEVFYDPATKRLRHAGEYGTFREAIVRDFLKFVTPRSLDMSTGFIITPMDDVSTQCDIVIFDARMTPLYQEGDRQRFFPVESVFCIGEVKSTLSRTQLGDALNKLAVIKALGERIVHPTIIRKSPSGTFDPVNHAYDLVPSILICQKLNFDLRDIQTQIDGMYDTSVQHRHKHNLILSVEDGLLSYFDSNGMNLPYPRLNNLDLKHRFVWPGSNVYVHFRLFASYMFMLTSNKTLLYPEVSDYMGTIENGHQRDQV